MVTRHIHNNLNHKIGHTHFAFVLSQKKIVSNMDACISIVEHTKYSENTKAI